MSRTTMAKLKNSPFAGSRVTANWNSGVSWRLPSGESLAEFALRFGFLAPSLLGPDGRQLKQIQRLRGVQ